MRKKSVINKYLKARQKIIELIKPLSEEKWNEVFLGRWSLKDFVAHCIGWDIWGLKAIDEIIKGNLPSYYKYYNEDWTKMNDIFVRRFKRGRKRNLLLAVKKSQQKLIAKLKRVPEELYNKDFGLRWQGVKITLSSDTLYQAKDEEKHAKQIKQWFETGRPQ